MNYENHELAETLSHAAAQSDLSEEIHEHLEEKIEELVASGMSRKEATAAARREFGNVTLIEEDSREVWRWPSTESFLADLRYGLRTLRKNPGFTAVAVLTLALGIAVNATMFSLVSAFLLRRPPGRDPEHVAVVTSLNPAQGFLSDANPVSAPNFIAWREANHVFADMAAADEDRTVSLTPQGQPQALRSAAVSPNYFSVLGVSPELGRAFSDGEDQPGRRPRRYSQPRSLGAPVRFRRFAHRPQHPAKPRRLHRRRCDA